MRKEELATIGGRMKAIAAFLKLAPSVFDAEEGSANNVPPTTGPFTIHFQTDNETLIGDDGKPYETGGWEYWWLTDRTRKTCWQRSCFKRGGG